MTNPELQGKGMLLFPLQFLIANLKSQINNTGGTGYVQPVQDSVP